MSADKQPEIEGRPQGQMWVKGLAGKWWVWVSLGFVFFTIVGTMIPDGQAAREKAIAYYSEGVTILALEYGIRLDEDVVQAMWLDDETLFPDMGGGKFFKFTFFDWWKSPAEKAHVVRDSILEKRGSPQRGYAAAR